MAMREQILSWLRRRREDARRAEAHADILIAEDRLAAYSAARQRQQDAHNAETFAHWGRVALEVARKTGRRVGLDTGTMMAMDAEPFGASPADFSGEHDQDRERGSDNTVEVDPIAELRRLISGR